MASVTMGKKIINYGVSLLLPVTLILLWEWAVVSGAIPNTLIASPLQVAVNFFELLFNGKLLIHSSVSVYRLLLGFGIGTMLGLVVGIMVGTSKLVEKIISPTMQFIAPIPPIAWIPLLIILLGIGEFSKIGLLIIAAFVVVYLNTIQGIRSADQKLVDVAHAYQKSNRTLITKILLPSALPNIFTGMRVALGLSWILLVAAEVIASSKGLGWLIWDSRNFSRPDDMIVGMIAIGILGKLSDNFLVAVEKRLTRWRVVFSGK